MPDLSTVEIVLRLALAAVLGGAVGAGAHARHEHVSIAGMVERAALVAGLIGAFGVAPAQGS